MSDEFNIPESEMKKLMQKGFRKTLLKLDEDHRAELLREMLGCTIEKIKATEDDVIILRGPWDQYMMNGLAKGFEDVGKRMILLAMHDEQSLGSIPIAEFYELMKNLERKLFGCRAKYSMAENIEDNEHF